MSATTLSTTWIISCSSFPTYTLIIAPYTDASTFFGSEFEELRPSKRVCGVVGVTNLHKVLGYFFNPSLCFLFRHLLLLNFNLCFIIARMLFQSTVFVKFVAVLLEVPGLNHRVAVLVFVHYHMGTGLEHPSVAAGPAINRVIRHPNKVGELVCTLRVGKHAVSRVLAEFKQVTSVLLVKASKDAAIASAKVGFRICKRHCLLLTFNL